MEIDPIHHGRTVADAAIRILHGDDFKPDIEIAPIWVDGDTF